MGDGLESSEPVEGEPTNVPNREISDVGLTVSGAAGSGEDESPDLSRDDLSDCGATAVGPGGFAGKADWASAAVVPKSKTAAIKSGDFVTMTSSLTVQHGFGA